MASELEQKRQPLKRLSIVLLAVAVLLGGVWLALPGNIAKAKNFLRDPFGSSSGSAAGYNAKSLAAFDLSDDELFASKNENKPLPPASLAKLFVIDFASARVKLDDKVRPSPEVLALVKPGSSVAKITTRTYTVKNLYAAMLVPSGNDAAYVLADYVGARLNPKAATVADRQKAFLAGLTKFLAANYRDTKIHDPSGYDFAGKTTALDIHNVALKLLKHGWFRDIVAQNNYTATLPDGSKQTWHNTNVYLDPASADYYRPGVKGIKTGSLGKDFNLVVLYQHKGKEYLVVSLGAQTTTSRYDDVAYVLNTIDSSYYLQHK